jgi:hypothetical protein
MAYEIGLCLGVKKIVNDHLDVNIGALNIFLRSL